MDHPKYFIFSPCFPYIGNVNVLNHNVVVQITLESNEFLDAAEKDCRQQYCMCLCRRKISDLKPTFCD